MHVWGGKVGPDVPAGHAAEGASGCAWTELAPSMLAARWDSAPYLRWAVPVSGDSCWSYWGRASLPDSHTSAAAGFLYAPAGRSDSTYAMDWWRKYVL